MHDWREAIMVFEYYMDDSNKWRWRLRTVKGLIVAESPETYPTRGKLNRGMTSLAREFKKPPAIRFVPPQTNYEQKAQEA